MDDVAVLLIRGGVMLVVSVEYLTHSLTHLLTYLLLLDIALRNGSTAHLKRKNESVVKSWLHITLHLRNTFYIKPLWFSSRFINNNNYSSVELTCWSSPPLNAIDNVIIAKTIRRVRGTNLWRGLGKRNRLRLCQLFTRNHGNARFQVTIKPFNSNCLIVKHSN